MKKGQLTGQIFIFIIAIILFGLILLYGYKAVKEFGQTQEDVTLIEFRDQFSSKVKQVSANYGSVKKHEIILPSKYSEICFVEYIDDKNVLRKVADQMYEVNPLIADALEGGTDQNVFLVPFAQTEIVVPPLEIEDGPGEGAEKAFLCIPNTGRITIRLEGLGDKTRVSEWQQELNQG